MTILRALPIFGALLTLFSYFRVWSSNDSYTSQAFAIAVGLAIWLVLPLFAAAVFHHKCREPRSSILLTIWLICLSAIWCLAGVVTLFDSEVRIKLGLLFVPALEWIALFFLYVFWSFERARKNP